MYRLMWHVWFGYLILTSKRKMKLEGFSVQGGHGLFLLFDSNFRLLWTKACTKMILLTQTKQIWRFSVRGDAYVGVIFHESLGWALDFLYFPYHCFSSWGEYHYLDMGTCLLFFDVIFYVAALWFMGQYSSGNSIPFSNGQMEDRMILLFYYTFDSRLSVL